MRTFFSKILGLNVITRQGDEVFLPDDGAITTVTFFKGSGLFEVLADGIRRRGQPLCTRVESLLAALDDKAPQKRRAKTNEPNPEKYPQNSTGIVEINTKVAENFACNDNGDKEPTSEAVRSYKSLHRSWKSTRDKILNSAIPENTVCASIRPPVKIGFDRLNKLLPKCIRRLIDKYPTEFEGCVAFPEPDTDGLGWHVHLFLHFRNAIPDDLEKTVFDWTVKAMQGDIEIINNDFLIDLKFFASAEQLVRALDYMNPTRGKKKARMPLYPVGRQIMRYYGEGNKPTTAAAPFGVVKAVVGKELTSLRHSTEFTDPKSGEAIYSRTALVFDVDAKRFAQLMSERSKLDESNDLFRCRAFVAPPNGRCDECPLRSSCGWDCGRCRNFGTEFCHVCKHGGTFRRRIDGQIVFTDFDTA